LFEHADKKNCKVLENDQIRGLNNITVFVRDPDERFKSGLYTAMAIEKINDTDRYLSLVESGQILNKHYAPQHLWLWHLYKYFRGTVKLIDYRAVTGLVGDTGRRPEKLNPTAQLEERIGQLQRSKYVDADKQIINKYLNKQVLLKTLLDQRYLKGSL